MKLIAGLMMLLMASTVFAFGLGEPLPIVAKVNSLGVEEFSVTNTQTGELIVACTNENGEAIVDFSSSTNGFNNGDRFTVKMRDLVFEFTYGGGPPAVFEYTFRTLPPASSCQTSVTTDNFWQWIIGFLAAILLGYGGLKFYKNKQGNLVSQHKHPGITAYHDPNTLHKNPLIRHKKGEWNPKYQKGADGKWRYTG